MKKNLNLIDLPEISTTEIINTDDFISLLLLKYYEKLEIDPTVEINSSCSEGYGVIVAFEVLVSEVIEGGYLQLILSGYADYVLENSFIESLRLWGAGQLASNVKRARDIYLNLDVNLQSYIYMERLEVYNIIKDINYLDTEFCSIIENESNKLEFFIIENINEFALLVL